MIRGIGIDVVRTERFQSYDESFLAKLFSKKEIELSKETKNRQEYLASRFAAKEALSKALGTGIRNFSLTEITVLSGELGKPYFLFEGRIQEIVKNSEVFLSFSHEKDIAVAMVVLCGKN